MRVVVTLLCSLFCFAPAFAADTRPGGPEWRAEMKALHPVAAADASGKAVRTNPDRSYPPSCLSNPLPTVVKGPNTQFVKSMADVDGNFRGANGLTGYFENVTVVVWRVACSNGKSAVLIGFDRASNREQTFPAPDLPDPWGTKAGGSLTPLRIVAEPNTWLAYDGGNVIYFDQVFVLEVYPGVPFDLDAAFTLSLDTVAGGQIQRTNHSIPAYNPATNPDSALALEITGYQAGSWYDPAHGGEGILFDVGERANGTRFAFFAWFTYDQMGFPYWIVGNADVPAGARTITIPGLFFGGGGFAGNFTPPLQGQSWGNVTFSFPSCNSLTLQFASTHNNATAPVGSGMRFWSRLTGVNGFGCE